MLTSWIVFSCVWGAPFLVGSVAHEADYEKTENSEQPAEHSTDLATAERATFK
jgi:hypothetical protein